jgi:murein DD-endopeptidase MepM/ murein hydrolase activator NlpD
MKKFKFWTYLNKKSYYAILLLCILTVIGTTTLITRNNMNILNKVNEQNSIDLNEEFGDYDLEDVGTINAYQDDLNITEEDIEGAGSAVAENSSKEETAKEDTSTAEDIVVASNKEVKETTPTSKEEADEDKTEKTDFSEEIEATFSFNENASFAWPVTGEIVMDYSADKLVYDKTLEQYRVHPAICIAPTEDGIVKAAAKGKVEMIKNDPETGVTVILNHGDGWKTIYGQLQKNVSVKQNEVVEKGQVIGEIGAPTKYSVALGDHVYFQVTKDDTPVDPKEFLNK